jgi:hypothetical protein
VSVHIYRFLVRKYELTPISLSDTDFPFETKANRAAIYVVSSREKLEEANRQKPESLLEIRDILK